MNALSFSAMGEIFKCIYSRNNACKIQNPFSRTLLRICKPLLFSVIMSLNFCAYDSKANEADMEEQQARILSFTIPTDVSGACIADQDTALICTEAASSTTTYISVLSTAYHVTIAGSTSADICNVLPQSPYFPNPLNDPASPDYKTYTDAAKICAFNCEKDYWTVMQSAGNCTTPIITAALTDPADPLYMANHAVYKTCIENCFIRGSIIPQL